MPILCRKNAEKATGKTVCGKRIGMARLRACMMYRVSVRMNRPVASAAAIPAQPAGREENVAAVSDRPVGGAFNGRKALVHRCTRLTCHSEERSDVAISQNTAGQLGSHRRNRNCLPEIATSACGLLAMTNLGAGAVGGVRGNLQLPMALTARKGHAASVRRQSRQRLRSDHRYRQTPARRGRRRAGTYVF